MSKITAVEWLTQQVNSDCLNSTFINKELIDKAKQMEKEQIIEACIACIEAVSPDKEMFVDTVLKSVIKWGNYYYDNTYGKE